MSTTEAYKKSRRLRELTVTLVVGDTTSAEMFKLPKGTRIVGWLVKVKTAFSGGTTELDIGISSNDDYFVAALSLATAGLVALGTAQVAAQIDHETEAITPVYMSVGASNTVGEVDVTLLFSQVVDRRF